MLRAARLPGSTRALLTVALVALLGTACRANFTVDVDVAEDGSGVVRAELVLDEEASEALLDLGDDATIPLSDLAQAGWEIGRVARSGSGETIITAEKAFGTTSQFTEVMAELTGERGVFRDFALSRIQTFGRVEYELTGVIDPRDGFASFSDPELETALGGSLGSIISSPPYTARAEDVTFSFTAELPGEFQEEGSTGTIGEDGAAVGTWRTGLAGQQAEVALRSARRSTSAQVLRGVAVVAGVLAGLIAFAQLLRILGSLRWRQPAAKVRPADARGRRTRPAPEPRRPEDPAAVESAGYRVVALDGMGVLYREGDDVRRLLLPFAREHGSPVTDEDIVAKARLLSLGRMTPADFWRAIGVHGDPNELDAAYLSRHQLTPGVVRYLRSLRDEGIRAACITNDAAAWAMKLRTRHTLAGLVDPWVVSGSVGVRKPDAPLFEVLRRVTGEPPAAILVIDDDLRNLDAARDLGFGTKWFTAHGRPEEARGHEIMRSFEGFSPVDTGDVVLEEDKAGRE